MYTPAVTGLAAGVLGLMFVVLSGQVVAGRMGQKVMIGEGESASPLQVAVRSHANFAEFVPLALILIGYDELRTGPTWAVKIMAGALVLARLAHPVGMRMASPNPFRAAGFMLSVLVIAAASILALVH